MNNIPNSGGEKGLKKRRRPDGRAPPLFFRQQLYSHIAALSTETRQNRQRGARFGATYEKAAAAPAPVVYFFTVRGVGAAVHVYLL